MASREPAAGGHADTRGERDAHARVDRQLVRDAAELDRRAAAEASGATAVA